MLTAENLTFAYPNSAPVIRDVGLTLQAGEILGILGPNGSGKTTLLKLLSGLLSPHQGSVKIEDQYLSAFSGIERARRLAFVPQNDSLTLPFTVWEVVMMGRTPYQKFFGFAGAADRVAAEQALQFTECLALRDRLLQSLSGGERRRVILARALAQETPLILLDEPTAHLDLYYQLEVCELLARLQQEFGRSAIVTLHDINLAAALCDRILLLQKGSIHRLGPPAEVLTAEAIAAVYQVAVTIEADSQSGRPFCRLQHRHRL